MAKHLLGKFIDNLPAKWLRVAINIWPPFVGASISVCHIASDFRLINVKLKLHWFNRNYVGVHFGGSIFSMTDPFDMLILLKNLGHDYIVWDKAARIDYKKPGRSTLHASFAMTEAEFQTVKEKTANGDKYIFDKTTDVLDEDGVVVATVVKTMYVRKKPSDQNKA